MWHSLIALNRSVTPRMLDILARTRRHLGAATAERLSQTEFFMEANLQTAEQHAGFKGGDEFLLELGRAYRQKGFKLIRFPKWFIDSKLFRNYEIVFPPWKKLPPHCLVHVDFAGQDLDIYLPEASLYEDMCFAYNQALDLKDKSTKPQVKAHTFYIRTAIISAFNFVECYLNGVAFTFITTSRRTVSQAERDLLLEWDSKNNRQRYVKFREKAVQYPKVLLNRTKPPFTESTCPSLDTLMGRIKLRDAVVHSSPRPIGDEVPKMRDLIEIELNDATKVVDAAVEFVKLLDWELHRGKYDNTWLLRRSVGGHFPPDSFT